MEQNLIPLIRIAGTHLAEAGEGLSHLTCSEISGVVDLLIVAGMPDLAAAVVLGHGYGDDDDTYEHHAIYLAAVANSDAYKVAREWVAIREKVA